MNSDIAITATDISKCYHVYNKPIDRLKQIFAGKKKIYYEEFWALREISVEIKKNEILGIIGSNGSGKSTLLQLICNIVSPSTGTIHINGRVAALLELGAGFNPEFTGRENVRFYGSISGLTPDEIESRLDEIIAFADIGEFIDQPVKIYSSGMFVRLAFAAAINVSPDILVIDEALAVGDARFRMKCMAKIKKFCDQGTVVIVSHDTSAIIEFCSRAIWIEAGTIQMDDKPKYVVDKYLQYMYQGNIIDNQKNTSESHSNVLDMNDFTEIDASRRQFGNHNVTIKAVSIKSSSKSDGAVYSGQPLQINMIVHAFQDIRQPIVGYRIKDYLGRDIIADNSALMGARLPCLSKGMRYSITVDIEKWLNLREGDYELVIAIADGTLDTHEICHWVHEAIVFKSIPERKTGGILCGINTNVSLKELGEF